MNKTRKHQKMRSPCPIANTLDLLGDRWTLLVIRDLFSGKQTYGEFQASPEGIPSNILADRLKKMIEQGLIEKKPYQQRPVRYAYQLTSKGRSLESVLQALAKWGLEQVPGTEARISLNPGGD